MTDELKRLIDESIQEEKADMDKYHKLSVMAESEGCEHVSGILEDISCEEKTHKCLLEKMLYD